MPYPVTFKADYVEKRSRLTTFFRLLLAIPHIIPVLLLPRRRGRGDHRVVRTALHGPLSAGDVRLRRGLAALPDARLRVRGPAHRPVPAVLGKPRDGFPVDLEISPPKSEYSRLKVLFRIILAIPVLIIHYAMQIVAQVGAFIAWFAIVLWPPAEGPAGHDRAGERATSSAPTRTWRSVTEDWPPFTEETTGHVEAAPAFGALAPTPPAAGPESPTSVPPGGYASPEREAAFPSAPAPPGRSEPEYGDVFQHEPPTAVEPEPPAPAPPAAEPEPEPPAHEPPPATTAGDPLGGATPAPEPDPEPEPYAPPEASPPSPGDWPDPPPREPRADDDADDPPPGPFGPSSTNQ